MNGILELILKKFTTVVLHWMTAKMTGSLSLTLHINQGGITDWHIQTNGKGE